MSLTERAGDVGRDGSIDEEGFPVVLEVLEVVCLGGEESGKVLSVHNSTLSFQIEKLLRCIGSLIHQVVFYPIVTSCCCGGGPIVANIDERCNILCEIETSVAFADTVGYQCISKRPSRRINRDNQRRHVGSQD